MKYFIRLCYAGIFVFIIFSIIYEVPITDERKAKIQKQEAESEEIKDVAAFKNRCKMKDHIARVYGREIVKARLKSPSSADFPWLTTIVEEYKFAESPDINCYYEVSGIVDSQNTFGGMMRSIFNIKITHFIDTDKWDATSIKLK